MNYVLLFPDEMRAESLGCYGHPLVKTPYIDRLAQEGTLFEQNYTTHPVCGPSRCNLVSGWYPHVNGKRTYYNITEHDPNFISHLNEAGFVTCHAGKDDMFDKQSMQHVFKKLLPFKRRDVTKSYRAIENAPYSMLYPPIPNIDQKEIGDEQHTEDAIEFIKEQAQKKQPFFLMLSWMNPHPPYTAPEKYYNMYNAKQIPFPRKLEWVKKNKPELYKVLKKYRNMEEETELFFRKINAVYLGMISYVDELTGRVVQTLKEAGIYEETTIILCSDHGDFAGDAGEVEKWPSDMTDMITRVPLIIRRPGCKGGQRIKTLTQSFDIFPTILDYENIELHYQQFGVSLRPQLEGENGDESRAVYCEGGYDINEPHCFEPTCFKGTPLDFPQIPGTDYYPKCLQQQERPETVCRVVMQRYKEWKLIVRTNRENELYNMQIDPWEEENLYGQEEYKDISIKLERKMLNWLIHTSDVVPIEGR